MVSYIRPDCNFLEHPVLQRGVLWGLGRLAHTRPGMVVDAASFIRPFLGSSDVYHRGYAVWLLRALAESYPCAACEALSDDQERFQFYYDGQFLEATVADAVFGNLPPG